MKLKKQNFINGISIFLFLILLPTYIVYVLIKDAVKDAVKIDKSEFIQDDNEQDSSVLIAERLVDSLKKDVQDSKSSSPKFNNSALAGAIKALEELRAAANRKRDSILELKLDSIYRFNQKFSSKLTGEKVSILITGIDARLGSKTRHADANHLLNIWFETGIIEIISIPRGTLADAGFQDSIQNYLANVRSNRGHKIYMNEISRISGVRHIDYYVEFGFSEAIGLMELLGFKGNAVQMLRMLRHRKSFGIGDWQRCYNQGQFIRQMLLNIFPKLDGPAGDLLLRGGLYLVDTDLNMPVLNRIIDKLKNSGFPKNRNDVFVTMKPHYSDNMNRYQKYDFTDKNSRDSLYNRLSNYAAGVGIKEEPASGAKVSEQVYRTLNGLIQSVENDVKTGPSKVISALELPFRQKSWLQISDLEKRIEIRNKLGKLLIMAYKNDNKPRKADEALNQLATEEEVLK